MWLSFCINYLKNNAQCTGENPIAYLTEQLTPSDNGRHDEEMWVLVARPVALLGEEGVA